MQNSIDCIYLVNHNHEMNLNIFGRISHAVNDNHETNLAGFSGTFPEILQLPDLFLNNNVSLNSKYYYTGVYIRFIRI